MKLPRASAGSAGRVKQVPPREKARGVINISAKSNESHTWHLYNGLPNEC